MRTKISVYATVDEALSTMDPMQINLFLHHANSSDTLGEPFTAVLSLDKKRRIALDSRHRSKHDDDDADDLSVNLYLSYEWRHVLVGIGVKGDVCADFEGKVR